jgi:hypothetical protein
MQGEVIRQFFLGSEELYAASKVSAHHIEPDRWACFSRAIGVVRCHAPPSHGQAKSVPHLCGHDATAFCVVYQSTVGPGPLQHPTIDATQAGFIRHDSTELAPRLPGKEPN